MTCAALLILLLAAPPPGRAEVLSSSSTVNMVKFFLKTATAELPAQAIPDFLAVDAKTLPSKLRAPYRGKREELLALKKIADGRNSGLFRRMGKTDDPACEDLPLEQAVILAKAGFMEIDAQAVPFVMKETECSECELQYEFTMRRVLVPAKKNGAKPGFRYFLHEKDPLHVLIGVYQNGGKSAFGTNFFGGGHPKCR